MLCKVLALWLQDCEEVFRFYETEYGKMLERWEKVIWINKLINKYMDIWCLIELDGKIKSLHC